MYKTGECECGLVKYTLTGDDPLRTYACHCLNCQTRSGSAFGEHAMLLASTFVCEGTTVTHTRTTDNIRFEDSFAQIATRAFTTPTAPCLT
jgi:hypothetical protein